MSSPGAIASSQAAPLPPGAKISLAAEILAAYARARISMSRGDFRDTLEALRAVPATKEPPPGDPAVAGRRLGSAVVRTLRLLPTDSRCLVRSLVLTRLLARRGMASRVVLGVSNQPRFQAHAWVELGGVPLLDPGGASYSRLAEL